LLGFSFSMPKQLISILKKKTEKERLSYYWLWNLIIDLSWSLKCGQAYSFEMPWNVAKRTALKCYNLCHEIILILLCGRFGFCGLFCKFWDY
jgi:hypothetical protein